MKTIKKNAFYASVVAFVMFFAVAFGGFTGIFGFSSVKASALTNQTYKTAYGYNTGDAYEVESGFGGNTVYEAKKLNWGEYIEIDGFKDDIWDEAYEIDTFVLTGNEGRQKKDIEIIASYMWDDESLYVWAEVYDDTYTLSWDNGKDWAAWGDYVELYVDTLHCSDLAEPSWNGGDGSSYRGKNAYSGTWPDGSEYEDCAVGKFKCSAGFRQTLGNDTDAKWDRGGAMEWQTWTWLSAACHEDQFSNFTSAFIYPNMDIHEPYDITWTSKGGIHDGAELKYGRPIGYTFEAQILFHSSDYMPEEGSVIGAGLRVVDMTEISWWDDGKSYNAYSQENRQFSGSPFVSVKNLPHLALLPADGSSGYVDDTLYEAVFTVNGEEYDVCTGLRGDEILAPEPPVVNGYTFIGWSGYKDGMKFTGRNKTFAAQFEREMTHLPDEPYYYEYQVPYDYTRRDGTHVGIYEAEKTSIKPTIDGVFDDIYLIARPIEITELVDGDTMVYAYAYVIWDNEYLYVYVVVEDDYISTKAADKPWLGDSVEVVIDTWNRAESFTQPYGEDYRGKDWVGEGQFRLNAGGNTLTGMHWLFDNTDYQKSGASRVIDNEGYTAEFKISWGSFKNGVAEGEEIGFAILVNDGVEPNRDGIIAIEAGMEHAFEYAGSLAKLALIDDVAADDEFNYEPDFDYERPNKDSSSGKKKGCGSSVFGVSALLSVLALGSAVTLKIKKEEE